VAKVRNVYVIGPSGSGKTALCAALALELKEAGYKVAYFKPVGAGGDTPDEDAVLLRELLGMELPVEKIVPFNSSAFYLWRYEPPGTFVDRVKEAYEAVAEGADVVVIGGAPSPYHLASLGLDAIGIAQLFKPLVLTVHRVFNDLSIDVAIFYQEYLRTHQVAVQGAILNHVPRTLLDKARDVYRRVLEDRGYRVLGIIPQRPEIALPTVREFAEVLDAEVLAGEESVNRVVEDIVVGAMTLESAMRYFRRVPNKAVITGGDRADLALAALETNTSALVLTGGLYPEGRVLSQAEEKGVPVLLTNYDTYAAVEQLRLITRKIRPGDQRSLQLVRENFREYCAYRDILEAIKD
jgi:BioD-like phosphotransacetylase family protein